MIEFAKIPIRKFGEKYAKNLHKAPIIITKNDKNTFVVLTWDLFIALQNCRNEPVKEPITEITILERIKKILFKKVF